MNIKSERAKALLLNPRAFAPKLEAAKKYPGTDWPFKASIEWEGSVVKKMSFESEALSDWQKVILEALAQMVQNKDASRLEHLTLRECEAFLRDRNSEAALEGLDKSAEESALKVFSWIRKNTKAQQGEAYTYGRGPFTALRPAERIKELQRFLNSHEVVGLYEGHEPPKLVDLDDLTVYVSAPYSSEEEREIFGELHRLGVETFDEENLNFIPDA